MGSVIVLEFILAVENCDVDPINRLEKATPLHLAVKLSDPDVRFDIVSSLLDAGANTKYGSAFDRHLAEHSDRKMNY